MPESPSMVLGRGGGGGGAGGEAAFTWVITPEDFPLTVN